MTYLGAFALFFLGVARFATMIDQRFFSLTLSLLAIQCSMAGLLLILRREASANAPWWVNLLAWLSAAMPLAMHAPAMAVSLKDILPLPGLALMIWSLIGLGQAFGIAPAHRGLILTGPYRTVRHPMYAGELLSLAGTLAAFPGWRNLVVLALFAVAVLWRIFQEEKILRSGQNGYDHYAALVKWRLIPGIW